MEAKYQYIVLTRETTKDWVKDMEVNSIHRNLAGAVDRINALIHEYYLQEFAEDEEWEFIPAFQSKQVEYIIKNNSLISNIHQVINVKSKDESEDDEDGEWGNLRIYIQKMVVS